MSSAGARRDLPPPALNHFQEIESDKRSGVSVELVDGKLNHMVGTIHGASEARRVSGGLLRLGARRPRLLSIRGRHLPHRHQTARGVPVRAAEDALHYKSLGAFLALVSAAAFADAFQASERELCERRHLSRRAEGPVEPCADAEDGAALRPVAARKPRAQGPAGCGGRSPVHVRARTFPADGAAVDAAARDRVRCCMRPLLNLAHTPACVPGPTAARARR